MRTRKRTWRPAILLPAAGALAIGIHWLLPDRIGQERVLFSIGVTVAVAALTAAWVVAFSPLAWRARLTAAALIVLAATALASTVRITGVTGDFLPILEWRWARQDDLPVAPGESAAPAAPGPATAPEAATAAAAPAPAPATGEDAPPALEPDPVVDSTSIAGATPPPNGDSAVAASPSPFAALSFPQFLGPSRDGVLPAPSLAAADWAARPPRAVWRHRVGPGWSGFAISEGLAVTLEQRGASEAIVAYDLATGAARWSHAYPARYATVIAGEGPRSTPTIAGGLVFSMGSTGVLTAVDLQTGRRRWQHDLPRLHSAPEPEWGRSSSPLVLDGRVIVNAGGPNGHSLVAYDAATGALDWQGGNDRVGYASPVEVTLAGVRQIVAFNQASVAGHDPHSGAVLWEQPWPGGQPNVAQPLPVGDDRLLVSSGYGVGSKLLRLTRTGDGRLQPVMAWESPRLKSKFANMILHDGFVYGLDDGVLVCLDLSTGERRWKSGRYGHGQLLLVAGLLLVQAEEAEIILVRPQPDRHVELTRFVALEGKTWNPPALAGRYLLVRNDREAALYELP